MTNSSKITLGVIVAVSVLLVLGTQIYLWQHQPNPMDTLAKEYPLAQNIMQLTRNQDNTLTWRLQKPLLLADNTIADKLVIYYHANKPVEAEYTTVINSTNGQGQEFFLPEVFNYGSWHASFFNGLSPTDPSAKFYLFAQNWKQQDYQLLNLDVQQFNGGYNFIQKLPSRDIQQPTSKL